MAADAAPPDAPLEPDASVPDGMPCASFSSLFDTCALSGAKSDLVITTSATYSTDTHQLVPTIGAATQPPHAVVTTPSGSIDVLIVRNFSLLTGATLRVTGTIPFGIAAIGNVSIAGAIDLSAGGAGARSAAECGTSKGANGTNNSDGAGGGGGGAYHGRGGLGGPGGDLDGEGTRANGGAGGTSINRPAGLVGGCSGGNGGAGNTGAGGTGGAGGGAVVIATAKTISITGTGGAVDVGGGGGNGGNIMNGGGGGGGSGGMILLECKLLDPKGAIVANGGGGGEGSYNQLGADGAAGMRSLMRAQGGTSVITGGGDGGDGGARTGNNGLNYETVGYGGGGGGGGATGYIAIACPPFADTGIISPQFALWP